MSNLHTHLTVLTPIDPQKLPLLERLLADHSWQTITHKVFSHCGMVHMLRVQIIDHLIPAMGELSPDRLASKFLLFIAELDGMSDDFYDHLYRFDDGYSLQRPGNGGFVRQLWGNCRNFPDCEGEVFFRRYMRGFEIKAKAQVEGTQANLRQILEALLVQALWRTFLVTGQVTPPRWAVWTSVIAKISRLSLNSLYRVLDWFELDPSELPDDVLLDFDVAMQLLDAELRFDVGRSTVNA